MESLKSELGSWFKTLWFDKSLLILNGNFNKNYRLSVEELNRCAVETKVGAKHRFFNVIFSSCQFDTI